ncbi:MAG: Multifunctional CCA protein [Candidatus Marinimicrobia bacterium]|nr:Multifunctional CCA protein [Candidatus Neomarinimicrobiota bacterium]
MTHTQNLADALAEHKVIDYLLKKIGAEANKQDIECYAVGGCVRDLLMHRITTDIDVMVVGDGVRFAGDLASTLGIEKIIPYEKFGTALIPYRDYQIEVATARTESYEKDSRKPTIEEADVETDSARRDFTINAMAIALNRDVYGDLWDPFGGLQDLRKELIKTPLDPAETFDEDPLRMLRAVRFAAQLQFSVDNAALEAIKTERERIEIVSQERITNELMKILESPKPSVGLLLLHETKLLEIILPEFAEMEGIEERDGFHHKDVLFHTFEVVDNVAEMTDKLELRFAALVHDIAKPKTKRFRKNVGWTFYGHDEIGARMLEGFARRMKLSNEMKKYLQKMTRQHLRPISLAQEGVTNSAVRRLLVDVGEDLNDLLTLCRADITSKNPRRVKRYMANFDRVVKRMAEVKEKDKMAEFQSPVRGDEIMDICDIEPGPLVGKIKDAIEEAILDGKIPNEHDAAKEYLLEIKDEYLE